MGTFEAQPITADSLSGREEWQGVFPGSVAVWEERADEGVGIGFDGLDPSAMVRAFRRADAPWPAIFEWHRAQLEALAWVGHSVRDDWWWEFGSPSRPGERFLVMDRSRVPTGWPRLDRDDGTTLYEVSLKARGPFTDTRRRDA